MNLLAGDDDDEDSSYYDGRLRRQATDEAMRELIRKMQRDEMGSRGIPFGDEDDPYGLDAYRQRVLDFDRPRYAEPAQSLPELDPEVVIQLRAAGLSESEIEMQKYRLRDQEMSKKMKEVDDKFPDNDLAAARRLAAQNPGYRGPRQNPRPAPAPAPARVEPRNLDSSAQEIDKILERAAVR